MKKFFKYILLTLLVFSINSAYAFEDCIITNDAQLTDIKIQHNDIIDVFPLITILNDKNTLIIHPLKVGQTKFSVLKNKKDKIVFDVSVTKDKTIINDVSGFEILSIDCPMTNQDYIEIEVDEPPLQDNNFELDIPPMLRERSL